MIPCTKSEIQKIIETLPDSTSIEEVMEKLYLFSKIEKGIQQANNGETISHEAVKKKLSKWLD